MRNAETAWQNKWQEILIKDGQVDLDQLKKELADFDDLIDRHAELVCEVTRHRLSYVTYPTKTVLAVMREAEADEQENQKKDDKEDGVCSLCDREFLEENAPTTAKESE